MPDINSLASRIDAEFAAVEEKIKKFQAGHLEAHRQRQQRLEGLGQAFDKLRSVWRPRLDLLVQKFGDRVKVTPRIVPSSREAIIEFESKLARVRLKLSATTDRDVQKVILCYDLEIIPVLIRFKQHDELELAMDALDLEAAAKWIDDRLIDFLQTYFSLGENEIYLKDQMVEDPVAHVRFPKFAAATTLNWQGQTLYFLGDETRQEFEKQQKIGAK
jgi:hypothetical protein